MRFRPSYSDLVLNRPRGCAHGRHVHAARGACLQPLWMMCLWEAWRIRAYTRSEHGNDLEPSQHFVRACYESKCSR